MERVSRGTAGRAGVAAFFVLSRTDEATSIEVFWPDGRSIARPLQSTDMNTIIEVAYPNEGEESALTSDAQVWMHANEEEESMHTLHSQCGEGFTVNTNSHCVDVNECRHLPTVCPHTRPVCTNTYGHYKCSSKKRCVEGYKPSRDGRACVAVASRYDSSVSSSSPVCPGFHLPELLLVSVLSVSGGLSPCR